MIVERITWPLKPGCRGEAIKLLQSGSDPNGPTNRIYSFMFGGDDETVILELEFEAIEDRAKFWAEWGAQPEAAEIVNRYQELMLSGGTHELLRLH